VQRIGLGIVLVLGFSIGLALTMVASGTIAALSVHHLSKRWSGFGEIARKAPFFSGAVVLLVGLYIAASGWMSLPSA
jgi:nickel/cobalt exporter